MSAFLLGFIVFNGEEAVFGLPPNIFRIVEPKKDNDELLLGDFTPEALFHRCLEVNNIPQPIGVLICEYNTRQDDKSQK